jgi:hypothetical protein
MSDEVEGLLRQVTVRGAPPELRARILGKVEEQLHRTAGRRSRGRMRPALAAAASLLGAIALNYWVNAALDRRLAKVLGPPVVRRQAAEIAAEIASITEPVTGQWAYERLTRLPPTDDLPRRYAVRLNQVVRQLTFDDKELAHETRDESPQMDRDRRSSLDQCPFTPQCVLRLEHWNAA